MLYLFAYYGDTEQFAALGPREWADLAEAHMRFDREMVASGVRVVSQQALRPAGEAQSVRVVDRETVVTAGPLLGGREALTGYYLVDVGGPDEALDLARRAPLPTRGGIEVRAVILYPPPGSGQPLVAAGAGEGTTPGAGHVEP